MTIINQNIDIVSAELIERWNLPHPAFASGQDLRSSERGLLQLLYGSMEHAARYQWQNGGRTLVDKTYLSILWTALELPPLSIGFETLASNLDRFIRLHLTECWNDLDQLDHEARHQLAIELVERASEQLFGSLHNDSYASNVLFFLCPQLPVFPYSESHHLALQAQFPQQSTPGYADYHQACRQLLGHNLPHICSTPAPSAETTLPHLNTLLSQTDWWPRRLLAQQIKSQGG